MPFKIGKSSSPRLWTPQIAMGPCLTIDATAWKLSRLQALLITWTIELENLHYRINNKPTTIKGWFSHTAFVKLKLFLPLFLVVVKLGENRICQKNLFQVPFSPNSDFAKFHHREILPLPNSVFAKILKNLTKSVFAKIRLIPFSPNLLKTMPFIFALFLQLFFLTLCHLSAVNMLHFIYIDVSKRFF